MPTQNPCPPLAVPAPADEATLWQVGRRLEINQPDLKGPFELRVLIAAPPHLARKYAFIGLIQGLTGEGQVALALILPPTEAGGAMEFRFRPAHPIADADVADLLHRDHVAQAVLARERQAELAALTGKGGGP